MKIVFAAMSGGVDSSVAAALLKRASFSIVGVFMKPWIPKTGKFHKDNCLWKEDREDALRVAAKLDIPLLTWDLSKEYEKRVAKYMIEGYRGGITPNPDVMCNKFIKFGVFLEKALKMGADYIATGHYIRLKAKGVARLGVRRDRTPSFTLHKAKDLNKDQSYFLYTFTQKQLEHCLFPIGNYTKEEVRRMARKFGLPNWDKKDSQGICFVGPLEFSKFLKNYIKPRKGKIVRKSDGEILGEHDGAWYYTIGQRHGIRIAHCECAHPNRNNRPYYVVDKDVDKNILYVDDSTNPKSQTPNPKQIPNYKFQIQNFNWVAKKEKLPLNCKVKTRYRQKDLNCVILKNGGAAAEVEIKTENNFIAPGQSAVFYNGDKILGGGIIQ